MGCPNRHHHQPLGKEGCGAPSKHFPGSTKVVAEYRRLNRVIHNRAVCYRTTVAEICFDDICKCFPNFRPIEGTGNGGADDLFVRDGVEISTEWVRYLARAADFYSHVSPADVETFIEAGPGLGLNTLAHIALNPHLRTVVNCDLPEVLYISTQFLKSIPSVSVVDYLEIREREFQPIPSPNHTTCVIYQIPPWSLSNLSGTFDYFLNSYSFQEMESDIVESYISIVLPLLRRGAYIQNTVQGHEPGVGGMKAYVAKPFVKGCFTREGFTEKPFEPLYGSRYWSDVKNHCLLLDACR